MPIKSNKKPDLTTESHFGLRVAKARQQAKLTQSQLAAKAGVHISHIQRIEAGTSQPTVDILKRLAEAMNASIDLLVWDHAAQNIEKKLIDQELIQQFIAIEAMPDSDKLAIKTILHAMIVKQRVEAALRPATSPSLSSPPS
jgi:transcriptional regulator with XRE-family HTH domain